MTKRELKRMSELWSRGCPIKQIANELGYSKGYVAEIIIGRRDMFPYRQPRMSTELRRKWAELVASGRIEPRRASLDAGVHVNTIWRWVREYKAGRL